MDFDDVAWDQSDKRFGTWKKEKLLKRENLIAVGNLIDKWRGGVPDTLLTPGRGAFNVWVRLKFADGGSAVMRIPCYGRSMFPEEEIQREASVVRFLERHTSIQVPHILHYGTTMESPDELGPFIIMEYIEHEYDLVDALNTPGIPDDERPILYPQISEERLIFA
jgi:aminoglycoside phosphotransferase (APT) family kinase protein